MSKYTMFAPPTKEELEKLTKEAEFYREEYADAEAAAWEAMVEAWVEEEGGLLIAFPEYMDTMQLPAAAGSEQRFPEEYQIPHEVADNEHITIYFLKREGAPYKVSATGTYRAIILEFFRGIESVYSCKLAGNAETLPQEISPSSVSRIEIKLTEDYYDE